MKSINNLLSGTTQSDKPTSQTPSQTTSGRQISDFTDHERDVTGYLFVRFRAMYPSKFYLIWPTEKELNLTKREFARDLGRYTRQQIDEAMAHIKNRMQEGDRGFAEPNVLKALQVLGELNTNKAMYQKFLPAPPEAPEDRTKRYKVGQKRCKSLLDFLDE